MFVVNHLFKNRLFRSLNSWLSQVGYIPPTDMVLPPVEIGFIYLELLNELDSLYLEQSKEMNLINKGCLS